MKTISRYIMTLALLLTAVTGAWAITDPNAVYWDKQTWAGWEENVTTHTVGDITITATGSGKVYQSESSGEPLALQAGANDAITFTSNGKPFASIAIITDDELNVAGWTYNSSPRSYEWSGEPTTSVTLSGCDINADNITFTFGTAEAPITVEWDAKAKTGSFEMPAFDVEIAPIYAPVAVFATDGNLVLIPTAIEGIYAESNDAIVKAGTVAKIGGTDNVQGTLMYAVSTSATEQPALTAFNATLPTAKDITAAGDVYVWYYIKGVDAPDGETATAENTFNDSEICETPLTVTVRSNKFDIQFKAANDNTIEAGKATVKVGDEAAEVKEGKLTGVKMNSKVTVTAKDGYKFRKVEVKKGGIVLLSAATKDDIGKVVCAAGHLHDAKTAVPSGCTAVGILGKVTETGHGLILALKNATNQTWNTINGWASASYAGTTLKVLPHDGARSTNLASYETLGETTVSNWAVAQKSDYEAIFTNLGSTTSGENGTTCDSNVNAYITTGVGGTELSGHYFSATGINDTEVWGFSSGAWSIYDRESSYKVRPVLGF